MFRIMRSELHRLLKSKINYILLGVFIGIVLMAPLLEYLLFDKMLGVQIAFGSAAFKNFFRSSEFTVCILLIFVVNAISLDLNVGTIKNKVVGSYHKSSIFLGQYLVMLGLFVCSLILTALIELAFTSILSGWDSALTWGFAFQNLGIGLLYYVFLFTLSFTLSTLFRNSLLTIVTILGLSLIILIVGEVIPLFQKQFLIDIFDLIPQFQTPKLLKLEGTDEYATYLIKVIVSQFIWIGGLLGIGLLSYIKTDFK